MTKMERVESAEDAKLASYRETEAELGRRMMAFERQQAKLGLRAGLPIRGAGVHGQGNGRVGGPRGIQEHKEMQRVAKMRSQIIEVLEANEPCGAGPLLALLNEKFETQYTRASLSAVLTSMYKAKLIGRDWGGNKKAVWVWRPLNEEEAEQ